MVTFGQRLKQLKDENKIFQKDIAEKTGISERAYRYYEGDKQEPTLGVLIALADFYGVSLDYLTGRTDNQDSQD